MLKPVFPAALVAFLLIAASASASSSPNLLANPGFETGDTSGWASISGDLATTPIASTGFWGARLTSNGQSAVAKIWQAVPVQPFATYQLSGSVRLEDPNLDHVIFRIQWLNSTGDVIAEEDSSWLQYGSAAPDAYTTASTHLVTSPGTAASTRLLGVAYGVDGDTFNVDFDDLAFTMTAPPPPTPVVTQPPTTIAPTPTNPPPATPPAAKTPTARPTRTATPAATQPAPEATEPAVFSELTNSGFEQPGTGGVFGWRKIGGTLTQSATPRTGEYAAALTSSTGSTKWVYQTIAVQGGQYYEAVAYARQNNDAPGEIFLRLSWYTSADGSGEAISNDDSTGLIKVNFSAFQLIGIDSVQAPHDAQSVRVRLMFRPADDGLAVASYDDVTFGLAASPLTAPEGTSPLVNAASIGGSSVPGSVAAPNTNDGVATAGAVYNAGRDAGGEAQPVHQSSNSSSDWLLALSIALPVAAISGVLSIPYLRRRLGERAA